MPSFPDVLGPASHLANLRLDNAHMLLVLSFATSIVAACVVAQIVHRIWFHPLAKVPGPVKYSVSYLPFLLQNYYRGVFFRKTPDLIQKYGPMIRVGPNHIMLDGEIAWPQVFSRRKANEAEFEKLPLTFAAKACSLIFAPHDIHRRQRRQLSHAFSDASLAQQEAVVQEYIDLLLDRLQTHAENGEFLDAVKWMNACTFDIIGDLTLSESFSSLENNTVHPLITLIFDSIEQFSRRRLYANYPRIRTILSCFSDEIGVKQHAARSGSKERARARMKLGEEGPAGRKDFMTYMLRKTRDGQIGMEAEEILESSPTIILAGSETTASALSALWFYLSNHPEAYKRLTEEIRSSFSSEKEISFQTCTHLEYLVATVNEILRIFPPAAETPARVSPGAFIEGIYIPPGTRVTTYQWATFRNPKHFKEPNSFIPERWLPAYHPFYDERFKNDNHAVFKPFSAGPRDCIGKNLALNELRVIISRVLYRFDYDVMEGQNDWHQKQRLFTVWKKGPLMLRLKAREGVA